MKAVMTGLRGTEILARPVTAAGAPRAGHCSAGDTADTTGGATLGTVTGSTALSVSGDGGVTFNQLNGGAVTLTSANGNLSGGNITGAGATLSG